MDKMIRNSDQIVWKNVVLLSIYHYFGLYGLYHIITLQMSLKTFICGYMIGLLSNQGTTSGVHRLWCHRTYKAKLPLRILLCFFQTISFQGDIYEWSRDHRVHHKFTDTDADPHNASRGFFFSHMGWIMLRKHPEVKNKGKTVDMSDILEDPVVQFQRKYYIPLALLCSFVIPTLIPWYYLGEEFFIAWTATQLRYVLSLHFTWTVNSAAHMWGTKPYNKDILPADNVIVAYLTWGEGWHNYHHTFPWDYKAAELGFSRDNLATKFINFMAKIGWAYDLKSASKEMVLKRIERNKLGEVLGIEEDQKAPKFVEHYPNNNKPLRFI